MSYLLGIDLGSSSVKVALLDADSGQCVATASYPDTEAPIKALQPGWAEQRPDDWWQYFKHALANLSTYQRINLSTVQAVGISYQMHGLVCLDKDMNPLRDAIIWCDSRGVPYGERAFDALGHDYCLSYLLNSPGNFTAAKLAWVKENEPRMFEKIRYIMLPGDYLALRLTGTPATTACGLSEMMLWDFAEQKIWSPLMDYFGFPHDIIPPLVPTFGEQGRVSAAAAAELGLKAGTPITYRAGDQPNNALSLGVFNPGEVATTAGTSGVVYGIVASGQRSVVSGRINTFLHVNHNLGVMHCINGCGILNAWMHRTVAPAMSYDEMNGVAATVPRATQEGIAFALYYGMELMGAMQTIKAGRANMFLSPLFREVLASTSGATIELYDTDGAAGAARGAGLGCGLYASTSEAFASLRRLGVTEPSNPAPFREAYERWKSILHKQ